MSAAVRTRRARNADATVLPTIERSAGLSFRSIAHVAWVADQGVQSAGVHATNIASQPVWIADAGDSAIGFLIAESCGEDLHICEVSVHADWHGQDIGARLIDTAAACAREAGRRSVTLTTSRDVPSNAPCCVRVGFVVEDDRDARLARLLDLEAARGFARETRCAMRIALP